MKIKKILYATVAFVLPWLLLIGGAVADIYNIWLYVGSITWFIMALLIFLSYYKF